MNPQYYLYTEGGGFRPHVVANPEDVEFLIVDLFCGAGGTSTGFEKAQLLGNKCALVVACVNHDPIAIKSHWKNHPHIAHFEEDIRTLDLGPLSALLEAYRILYPKAKVILWASLECTNFSKAKGGQPRDADSRTLADHLPRYIHALNPDYIQIENVVEFMSWGPLDKNGKPVSKKSGADWMRWRSEINAMGFRDEWKELNSADFGAYTSRNRLFGCFAKPSLPIVWPVPTHSKKAGNSDLFGSGLKKWKAVKDVLDFSDEGESILTRKKRLSDKTLERIYAGLIKYVAGGKDSFLAQYNGGSNRIIGLDGPCNTIPTENRFAKVQTSFIAKYYSGRPEGKVIPVTGPAGTITCFGGQQLVNASFIAKYYSGDPKGQIKSVDVPADAILCKDHHSVVQASFLAKYYGNGDNVSSINDPAGTVTTKDRFTKVQPVWIDKMYSGNQNHQGINQPAGTIMTNDKHQKVTCKPFIMDTNYNNVGSSIEEPKRALLASRRHSYIINPSHGGHCTSVDVPSPVIVARQDKAPLYVSNCQIGPDHDIDTSQFLTEDDILFIESLEADAENPPFDMSIRLKIIEFMLLYGIADIKMRMLKVKELKLIQGFPEDYELCGNQSDQKKFIGNSVVPHVVTAWCETMARKNRELRREAA